MGFLKKSTSSSAYPASRNRIRQQQGTDPSPIPASVYQSNGIPHSSTSTVRASSYPAPVVATAFVPGQTSASVPVVATAYSIPLSNYTASAPPMENPAYNPGNQKHDNNSKFWECRTCTFPNLRTEEMCKGCGTRIPPGLLQIQASGQTAVTAPAAPVYSYSSSPTHGIDNNHHQQQQHSQYPQHSSGSYSYSPSMANQNQLSNQMNNLNINIHNSSSNGGTMRVPIPNGMQPGQKIKVRTPTGSELVKSIPPTHEWAYDDHGKPFFRMNFTTTATALTSPTHSPQSTTRPQPYSTSWRSFHPRASSTYTPPPLGMTSVPHSPRGLSSILPNGRHKSLLVGINYHGTRAALKGCINDAKNMQTLLLRNGFPNDGSHMLLLTDERSGGGEYQPTHSNLLKAFRWFLTDVQKGDVLFFHFSGHGGQTSDSSGMESDGYNETIVPVDFSRAGQITDDVLWGSLVSKLPEGVRLSALMDMCHSGTGLDLPYDYNVDARRWREDTNPAHSVGDVVLFSGCEDAQTSADVQSGRQAGGAMTMAFTRAYEQFPMVTYHDFLTAVKKELRKKGFRQRPQLTSSQQFDANGRIFTLGGKGGVGGGGVSSYIESNHNPKVGRQKKRHVRPARPGFGGGGGNDMFAMAAAGAGAMLFANALGNMFE